MGYIHSTYKLILNIDVIVAFYTETKQTGGLKVNRPDSI